MKKSLILATVVIAFACAIALIAPLAGFTSFNMVSIPTIIAGVFACGLVLMAFSDYSRKPSFRVRSASKATPHVATAATRSEVDAASAWTYTTVSA